jgi:hypothetical protein
MEAENKLILKNSNLRAIRKVALIFSSLPFPAQTEFWKKPDEDGIVT